MIAQRSVIGLVEAVGLDLAAIGAGRDLGDRLTHGQVRALPHSAEQGVGIVQALCLEELDQSAGHDRVGRELGHQVADHDVGHPHVEPDDAEQVLVRLAAP